MADKKLSELAELAATPANDDEAYIRDVSELASAESKRITIANLMAAAVAAVKAGVKLNELQAPDGDIAMATKKFTGLGAPSAQDHSLRYGRAEIRNEEIAAAAAIIYSKLNLTGAIKAADIEAAAGIPLSKLVDAVCSETEADNKIAAVTGLNKVKLPSPSESDYVTPSAALASSERSLTVEYGGLATRAVNPYNENFVGAWKVTIPEDTYAKTLYLNVEGAGGASYGRMALYDDSAGNPNNLLGEVSQKSLVEETWNAFSLPAAIPIPAGDYWIAIQGKTNAQIWLRYDDGVSGDEKQVAHAWGAFPDPFGTPSDNTRKFNLKIFCKVEVGLIKDEDLATMWRPNPPNEVNAWCRLDMGALKITSGCRIYWGADANYRPTAYRIETSPNGTTWTTVVNETEAAPASAWKEYGWNARYARYIRMIVDTHGATGTEIFEADYYSRLVERVASEHGHGSGITKHLKVKHSKGHPVMLRGGSLRGKIRDLPSLIEYVDFMLKGLE